MTLDDIKARCTEEGQCWLWNGALDGHGRPQVRHNGKTCYLRRVVREMVTGEPTPPGYVVANTCGIRRCVSPECSCTVTHAKKAQMAAKRGAYNSAAKAAKIMRTKRAESWITDELVNQIRLADGPASRISAETRVSISHVKAIRRGVARRDMASPFAGLMT